MTASRILSPSVVARRAPRAVCSLAAAWAAAWSVAGCAASPSPAGSTEPPTGRLPPQPASPGHVIVGQLPAACGPETPVERTRAHGETAVAGQAVAFALTASVDPVSLRVFDHRNRTLGEGQSQGDGEVLVSVVTPADTLGLRAVVAAPPAGETVSYALAVAPGGDLDEAWRRAAAAEPPPGRSCP